MQIVAFSLNFLLSGLLGLPHRIIYALVMINDFILGYIINRYFVFKKNNPTKSGRRLFIQFVIAGASFRVINWGLYVGIIEKTGAYILLAQLVATGIVLVFKYLIYNKIFR